MYYKLCNNILFILDSSLFISNNSYLYDALFIILYLFHYSYTNIIDDLQYLRL